MQTKVKDIMKNDPITIAPTSTLQEAARQMASVDCGVLPVGTANDLQGMITDRDIVLRAIAQGKDTKKELVQSFMTQKVFFCMEDDTLEEAADLMRQNHVNRLVVKNSRGDMSGILSFGCILRKDQQKDEIHSVIEHAVGKKAA